MTNGGDAAEQMVRLSLEGVEVAAKLTGSAAKSVAVMLAAALRQGTKTRGAARLDSLIRSGKELKVFSLPEKDLKKFKEQAKRYGVLYCVLANKHPKGVSVPVDVIARAEDAAKIQRIFERFSLGAVEQAHVAPEPVPAGPEREESRRSGRNSEQERTPDKVKNGEAAPRDQSHEEQKPSVREKLNRYRKEAELDRKRSQKERTKERNASRKSKRFYNSRKHLKEKKAGDSR